MRICIRTGTNPSSYNLSERLNQFAQQEGLSGAAVNKAVWQTLSLLNQLKQHPIYQQIKAAKLCWTELPFSWSSPAGNVNGVIDVLFQDQSNNWHLLDWKTGYVAEDNIADLIEKYQTQLSIYFQAVSEILKIKPLLLLAFLNPRVIVVKIEPKGLTF